MAFILNRPLGLLENTEYRKEVEKQALQKISSAMAFLEDSCGILSAFFAANVAFAGQPHYYRASSKKMEVFVQEQVRMGIIEKIIARKLYVPLPVRETPRQWYVNFINNLISEAGKILIDLNL